MPGTGTFLRHPRACRGHPDSAGWPCLPLEITDKPGDDLRWISCISLVMAGLVPAIHTSSLRGREDVDARHKAGHDGA